MNSLSIISLNIFGFRKIRDASHSSFPINDVKKALFHDIISKYNPDLLLLQEDLYILGRCLYPPNYYYLAGKATNEGLMNTILVREDLLNDAYAPYTELLASHPCLEVERCASTIIFKGFHICNLHLSGGRVDDAFFQEIVGLRDKQVERFINYDIVAGDWNGNPNDDKVPSTHPVFLAGNDDQKRVFAEYFKSGHRPLLDAGMRDITVNTPTDIFGGNPDHIYYDPNRFQVLDTEVIDMITPDLSDHNGIYVELEVLSNKEYEEHT